MKKIVYVAPKMEAIMVRGTLLTTVSQGGDNEPADSRSTGNRTWSDEE